MFVNFVALKILSHLITIEKSKSMLAKTSYFKGNNIKNANKQYQEENIEINKKKRLETGWSVVDLWCDYRNTCTLYIPALDVTVNN